jgi:2-haloacid dehalogenase
MAEVKVLAFDLFGTVVDWRSGIARAAGTLFARLGRSDIDPHAFADAWRRLYQPAMEDVRSGRRAFTRLDTLHRETLDLLLGRHGLTLDDADAWWLAHGWRRLDPWPDAVAGLTRLKARWPIVTLSNANVALALEMARHGGLPWDAILGAEVVQAFKPMPEAYLRTADVLGIQPGALCLVAAHHSDLAAARACGLQCAFIHRPMEYGGATAPDAHMAQDWEWSATSLVDLAEQMGC